MHFNKAGGEKNQKPKILHAVEKWMYEKENIPTEIAAISLHINAIF